jgi:hypothetical protein
MKRMRVHEQEVKKEFEQEKREMEGQRRLEREKKVVTVCFEIYFRLFSFFTFFYYFSIFRHLKNWNENESMIMTRKLEKS